MGIFDRLGKQTQGAPQPRQGQPQQMMNPRQMRQAMQQELGKLSANPGEYLKGYGLTIPDGMTDARQITEHLLQSGQISAPRYQAILRMVNSMPR